MTAQLIDLDSRRPKTFGWLFCMFCGNHRAQVYPSGNELAYWPCPKCDEVASVEAWRVERVEL